MKKILLMAAVLFMVQCAFAETGTVVKRISGCDYYMVYAPSGYAVLEWYGGWDPDEVSLR